VSALAARKHGTTLCAAAPGRWWRGRMAGSRMVARGSTLCSPLHMEEVVRRAQPTMDGWRAVDH
jgi:hypothetical protein